MLPIPKPQVQTEPASLAVSLDEVKEYLRLDNPDENQIVETKIKAVTKRLEAAISRKFVTQTWDIYFDNFGYSSNIPWWDGIREGAISTLSAPNNKLIMPFGPMQSVTGVYTYDEDNTEYIFSSTNYYSDIVSPQGAVLLKSTAVWPTTVLRPANGIKVRAIFGFGTAAAGTVPKDIQEAIKVFVAYAYEHRGDELTEIPPEVLTLVAPYMRLKV